MKTYLLPLAICLLATPGLAQFIAGQGAAPAAAENQADAAGQPAGQQQGPGVAAGGPQAAGPQPNLMFEAIDANGDGVITKLELRKAIARLRTLDTNNDGVITLAEVSPPPGPAGLQGAALAPGAGLGVPPGGQRPGGINRDHQRMIGQMLRWDLDGDGMLSPDEVPRNSRGMLQDADLDKDGRLGAAELQMVLERNDARARAMWAAAVAGRQDNAGAAGAGRRGNPPRNGNQDGDESNRDDRP